MKTKTKNPLFPKWVRWQKTTCPLAGVIVLLVALCSFQGYSQGNLLITPSRIVFDGTSTSEVINLANTGQDTARYMISFIQYKMTDDGTFKEIIKPESGQFFVDPYVRYFPRAVVLAPNESQVVKIQTTNIRQLNPGEYRSHLYFRSVPDIKPLGEEEVVTDTSAIAVRLTPVFGITIPVILRIGKSNTETSISDLSLQYEDDKAMLTVTINRSGNMSVYGNIVADYISPDGKTVQIGMVKGVAVYTPNALRKITIPINFPSGVVPSETGKLRVVFSSVSDLETIPLAMKEVFVNQAQ